jgi:hypothetical protein
MLCDSCRVQQIICFILLGFYGLLLVLKVDPLKAFFGSLALVFHLFDNYTG